MLEGEQLIDTLVPNENGIGQFYLTPKQGDHLYTLDTDSSETFSAHPAQFAIPEDELLFMIVMDHDKTQNQLYTIMKDPMENAIRPFHDIPLKTLAFRKNTQRWPHISLERRFSLYGKTLRFE